MKTTFLAICLSLASVTCAAQKQETRAQKRGGARVDEKLISCVETGDADCVAAALAAGAQANAVDAKGVAALILAAEGKSTGVVKNLLEAGADVNKAREGEGTPLCRAALFGRPEIVEMLLAKKADVNVVCDSDHGDTPLMDALRGTMAEVVPGELSERLVQASGDDEEGDEHEEAGGAAAERAGKLREVLNTPRDNFVAIARALLARGADVNVVADCDMGETALMYAAMGASVEMVKELLARGADVKRGAPVLALLRQYERELEQGNRLALPALSSEQIGMLKWSEKTRAAREEIKGLLRVAGAMEDEAEDDGENGGADADALEEAATATFRDVIERDDRKDFARLVDAYAAHPLGALVLPEALRTAIIFQRTELVKLLLERGTNPNPDGGMASSHPPLQQASFAGQLEYVRMLLDVGADVNRKDGDGRTALDAAESQAGSSEKHRAVVELLKARGATSAGREP